MSPFPAERFVSTSLILPFVFSPSGFRIQVVPRFLSGPAGPCDPAPGADHYGPFMETLFQKGRPGRQSSHTPRN